MNFNKITIFFVLNLKSLLPIHHSLLFVKIVFTKGWDDHFIIHINFFLFNKIIKCHKHLIQISIITLSLLVIGFFISNLN